MKGNLVLRRIYVRDNHVNGVPRLDHFVWTVDAFEREILRVN